LVLALFAALSGGARWRWLFDDALPLWTYATFTQNIYMGLRHTWGAHALAPTWSLSVEEQFYLVAPFVIRFAPRAVIGWGVAAGLILAPLARWAFPGFHTDVMTPFRLDPLLFGVALALIVRSPRRMNARTVRVLLYLGIAGAAVMSVLPDLFGALTYSYVGLVAALLILVVIVDEDGPESRWLRHPALVFLGVRSYGIYLLHEGVNGVVHALLLGAPPRLDLPGALVTLASLALTLLLATLSYRYLERPILDWGHRAAWRDVDFAADRSLNG
jgi:peptidoglycan/LPS O-acetylase OafA/YrhL